MFCRVVDRFQETGTVQTRTRASSPMKNTEQNQQRIKDMVEKNPRVSIRRVSMELNLTIGLVWKVPRKELKMYPYKPHNV